MEFHTKGVELAFKFEGIHAPFSWHDNADGCPDWAAHNRFEQSGLTRGSLTLGDRHVEFTGVGHRDHSWGSRNWNMLQHWKWINAATPDGASSLHAMIMWVKGETLVNGYLNFNGQVSPIVSAEASANLDDSEETVESPVTGADRENIHPKPHRSFGGGVHRCLGKTLARMELTVVVAEWLCAIPDFGLEPGFTPGFTFTQGGAIMPSSLRLRWAGTR